MTLQAFLKEGIGKHTQQYGGFGSRARQDRKCAAHRKEHARLKKHERRAAKMDKRYRRRS